MRLREGTFQDGLDILADLREQQVQTLKKLEIDPVLLLQKAMVAPAVTVLVNERPAAMFGVISESLIGLAKIWLIATPLIEQEPIAFLRTSRKITQRLYALHGTLIGMVDCDFPKSQAWLEWCGFVEFDRSPNFVVMRYSGGN